MIEKITINGFVEDISETQVTLRQEDILNAIWEQGDSDMGGVDLVIASIASTSPVAQPCDADILPGLMRCNCRGKRINILGWLSPELRGLILGSARVIEILSDEYHSSVEISRIARPVRSTSPNASIASRIIPTTKPVEGKAIIEGHRITVEFEVVPVEEITDKARIQEAGKQVFVHWRGNKEKLTPSERSIVLYCRDRKAADLETEFSFAQVIAECELYSQKDPAPSRIFRKDSAREKKGGFRVFPLLFEMVEEEKGYYRFLL